MKNGEIYNITGDKRRSDLQRKVNDIVRKLEPRIREVEEDFAGRYSWTINGEINSI
jgi:hypothetical protein